MAPCNCKQNGDEQEISVSGRCNLRGRSNSPRSGEQAIAHVCFLILSGNPRIFSEALHLDSQQVRGLTQTFYKALGKPNVDLFPKRKLKLLSSEVRPFQSKMFESLFL